MIDTGIQAHGQRMGGYEFFATLKMVEETGRLVWYTESGEAHDMCICSEHAAKARLRMDLPEWTIWYSDEQYSRPWNTKRKGY